MFLNRGPSSARATGAALAKARLSEQSAVRGCLPRPRPADRASRDVWAARLIYYSGWSRRRSREVRGDEIMRGTAECLGLCPVRIASLRPACLLVGPSRGFRGATPSAARLDGPAMLGFVQAMREGAVGASWAPNQCCYRSLAIRRIRGLAGMRSDSRAWAARVFDRGASGGTWLPRRPR